MLFVQDQVFQSFSSLPLWECKPAGMLNADINNNKIKQNLRKSLFIRTPQS